MKKLLLSFGVMAMTLAAIVIFNPSHAAAASLCDVLARPSSPGSGNAANCQSGQVEDALTSMGGSSDQLKAQFKAKMAQYASGYGFQRVGVAYIEAGLGGAANWSTNISDSSITLSINYRTTCANTAYNPFTNSVQKITECVSNVETLEFYHGATLVYQIKMDCGNPLGNFGSFPKPKNNPPTGAFVSASCNKDGTINLVIHYGDADGTAGDPASAFIKSNLGTPISVRQTAPAPYVFGVKSYSNLAWPPSYFPIRLFSHDAGGSGDIQVDTQPMPACGATAIITLGCTKDGSGDGTAKAEFSDPNGGNPVGYFAIPGSPPGGSGALTGLHPSIFYWTVPAARAAPASWGLWFYVQNIGSGGWSGPFGAVYHSCAGTPSGPKGTIHLACNPDGTGRAWATGVSGASAIYFANAAGNPVSGQHPTNWVWNPVNPLVAPPGSKWTLQLGVVPSSGGPNVLVDSASITCPLAPPPPGPTCSTSTFPSTMEVNVVSPSFKVSVQLSTAPPSPPPNNPVLHVDISGPGGYNKVFANQNYTYNAATHLLTSTPMQFTPPNVGTYNLTWRLTGFVNVNCGPDSGIAGTHPYFDVQGGDVAAGDGFGSGNCALNTTADVKSWNYDNTAPDTGYYGAGSQLATFAGGNILSFITGHDATKPPGSNALHLTTPHDVSFSNTVNVDDKGNYGGSFSNLACLTDYYNGNNGVSTVPSGNNLTTGPITTIANPGSLSSGRYKVMGDLKLATAASSIGQEVSGAGKQITLFVNGDVYIANNVMFSYGSITGLPSFTLHVAGNIYIGAGVTQLSGVYTAQDNGGNKGVVATCGTGLGSETTQYGACPNRLTIDGSVIAQTIRLERSQVNGATPSTLHNNSGPAEIFQFSPETWLSGVGASGSVCGGGADCTLDAITSLPPIL